MLCLTFYMVREMYRRDLIIFNTDSSMCMYSIQISIGCIEILNTAVTVWNPPDAMQRKEQNPINQKTGFKHITDTENIVGSIPYFY